VELLPVLIGVAVCAAAVFAALRLRPSKQGDAAGGARSGSTSRTRGHDRVDPFGVGEPWRRHVAAAQSAQRRFVTIVGAMNQGPLRSRMADIGRQVDRGVLECWQIAKHGDQLDDTIRSLDGAALRARLERATDDAMRTSIQAQLDSLDRIRAARDQTNARLHGLQTQLGELVSQAAEVSIGSDNTAELGSAVDDVVVQLEALLQAVDEVNTTGRSRGFEANGPGTASPAT
jgi:hypothetical protein